MIASGHISILRHREGRRNGIVGVSEADGYIGSVFLFCCFVFVFLERRREGGVERRKEDKGRRMSYKRKGISRKRRGDGKYETNVTGKI